MIKVNRRTVKNFLEAWDIMSDNPTDWQEIVHDNMDGDNKEYEIEKVEEFIENLRIYANTVCAMCKMDNKYCRCCKPEPNDVMV